MNEIEDRGENKVDLQLMTEQIYDIRADLLRIRRTVIPMRDLLYRLLNSDKIPESRSITLILPIFTTTCSN